MGMAPERSNPLHNFRLPQRLRWGSQRHLRCKKPDDDRSDPCRRSYGIEAIGERLMMDFKLKIDRMKVLGATDEAKEQAAAAVVEGEEPWNLRVRRSSSPTPVASSGVLVVERRRKKVVIRERCVRGIDDEEEKLVKKLRVRLEREEIEKDFVAMGGGIKLPRRTKKRPRSIQKELDTLFPGLWLTEVNLERYAVRPAHES